MNPIRAFAFSLLMVSAMSLEGCASLGLAGADVTVATTTAAPNQARNVGDAIKMVKLLEDSLDLVVTTQTLPEDVRAGLTLLVKATHAALLKVEDAQRAGNNAAVAGLLSAFNQSYAIVIAYENEQGIKP